MSEDIITFEAPAPEVLSELLPSYEVYNLIAQGGMGAVYHAKQISLERSVAIKLLPSEFGDQAFKEQFAAEARAMAKLNHPNLIGIYDYGEVEGMPFIVMEYVEGKSLYYSCYQKAIEQGEAIRLVTEICAGLAHAHDNGIVHRDIKPANILLDGGAHAKIGDFGLASPSDEEGDGIVYGTPGYAAPEILSDVTSIGTASDLFAVGVILHELLTGKLPKDDPRPPSRLAKCHPQLDRIVRKATRSNPEARYATAHEIIEDLSRVPIVRTLKTEPQAAQQVARTSTPKLRQPAVANAKAEPQSLHSGTSQNDGSNEVGQSDDPPIVIATVSSTNWPFIRNLMIIALLIPALMFAWGRYEEQKKEQELALAKLKKEQNAEEALRKARAEQDRKDREVRAKLAEQRKAHNGANKRKPETLPQPEKTPWEELADLRSELRGGSRSTFPKGTIKRGSDFFFFIEEAMTWSAASQFSEDHGGHLVTPVGDSDLAWVGENQGERRRSWIGGGAVGNNDWGWVNGEEWKHKKPLTNLGSCAAVTNTGILGARPNGEKLPFFIQWSADGLNHGSLESQLKRLKGTLGAPSPAWPPGTIFHQGRSYLLVNQSVSWDQADLIAGASGGHLAVSSNIVEKDFLREALLKALGNGQSAWLGGRRADNGQWTWSTREQWDKPDWAPNSPSGEPRATVLRFIVHGVEVGWDDVNPSDPSNAQAFLIEWSSDAASAPPAGSAEDTGAGNDEIRKLRVLGARHLRRLISDHAKRGHENLKRFKWDLNSWLRSLPKSQHDAYSQRIEAIKANLPDGSGFPENFKFNGFPGEVTDDFMKAKDRQMRFDATLNQDILNFRNAYLGKLLVEREQAEEAGFKERLPAFDSEIQSIGQSVQDFRKHFAMD